MQCCSLKLRCLELLQSRRAGGTDAFRAAEQRAQCEDVNVTPLSPSTSSGSPSQATSYAQLFFEKDQRRSQLELIKFYPAVLEKDVVGGRGMERSYVASWLPRFHELML